MATTAAADDKSLEQRANEYQDCLKKYKQVESEMQKFNEQLQAEFRAQNDEVSIFEVENYKLLEEL